MLTNTSRMTRAAIVCAFCLLYAAPGVAQQSNGVFDNLFSRGEPPSRQPRAQAGEEGDASDLGTRLDRLENQIRQLTGAIEQLQFRNQQLEQQLRVMQGGGMQGGGSAPVGNMPPPQMGGRPGGPSQPNAAPPMGQPAMPGRQRGDLFDPSANPDAPGAPRALGSAASAAPPPIMTDENNAVGAPGGRPAGAPLDLGTLSGNAAGTPSPGGNLPSGDAPIPGTPGSQLATLPPSATPKDEYDLAYGYVLRKDYALAEQAFRDFLKKNKGDKAEPDAHYWLGESFYQRQRYQDAADSFLIVVRNFENSGKAPDALLRLGQSLAAMNQKELACASFGEIERKYPRASASVKRTVASEQKRVKC